jgi:uncharacterized protein YjbJ (UPF0337 family)
MAKECREGPSRGKSLARRRPTMNWDQVAGNWKQIRGKVQEKWGELTDDELDQIAGRRDQLVGKLQERLGYERDRAEREVDELAQTW